MQKTFYEGPTETTKGPLSDWRSLDHLFMMRFAGADNVDQHTHRPDGDYHARIESYHLEPQGVTLRIMHSRFKEKPWETQITLFGNETSIAEVEKRLETAFARYNVAQREAQNSQKKLEVLVFPQ